jgi:hypothetical protein
MSARMVGALFAFLALYGLAASCIVGTPPIACDSTSCGQARSGAASPPPSGPPSASVAPTWFLLDAQFIGRQPDTWSDVQMFGQQHFVNAYDFWATIAPSTQDFIINNNYALTMYLPASTAVLNMRIAGGDADPTWQANDTWIWQQRDIVKAMTARAPADRIFWGGLTEWDGSGGYFSRLGQPKPGPGTTRQQQLTNWMSFYQSIDPLNQILGHTPQELGYNFMAYTDYSFSSHYAYEMGVYLNILERDIEELGDPFTGIAYARGAARQYARPWGMDISGWRNSSNTSTDYIYTPGSPNYDGQPFHLNGGWSQGFMKRHVYSAYMAGANMVLMEALVYFDSAQLNPTGMMLRDFGNFALVRHPNRPPPLVPIALMLDHAHGFEPKYGRWTQGDAVWYWGIPYSEGDRMFNNLLRAAYPDHWVYGTTPNAPWTSPAQFQSMLASGFDPRPYEPMPTTRWGESFDVLLNNATSAAMSQYRALMYSTDVPVSLDLKGRFAAYVSAGGTLVLNARQIDSSFSDLTGVQLGAQAQGSNSVWSGASTSEPAYTYTRLVLAGAQAVATNGSGDALVTVFTYGQGRVFVTAPDYLQDMARTQILNVGQHLIDNLIAESAAASVAGPPSAYLVNSDAHTTTVTVINNSGSSWSGQISFRKPASLYSAREWTSDGALGTSELNGWVIVNAQVPPYDLRVFALQF